MKKTKTMTIAKTPSKNNLRDLWPLWHWLHFWQLRTTTSTFKVTLNKGWQGQPFQFLRCLFIIIVLCEGGKIQIKNYIYRFAIWAMSVIEANYGKVTFLKIYLGQNKPCPMFLLVAVYKWYCDHVLAYLFRGFWLWMVASKSGEYRWVSPIGESLRLPSPYLFH